MPATILVEVQERQADHRISWVTLGQIGAVVVLLSLLYTGVMADLAKDWWNEPNYSYGMLIPPLALYFAWAGRKSTLAIPRFRDIRGVFLTAVACIFYATGKLGSEFFLPRISLVILLGGLIWTFWGINRLRSLYFPLILLATMVPLPVIIYNWLSAPLQLLASEVATSVAQVFGVSVYRDGNLIILANLSLGVEEACSGLNSLSSLIIASLILGYLDMNRSAIRWMLVLLSVPLAIGINIVRVAGTAILADQHQEFARGFYHSFSGWLVFVFGFAALYAISGLLKRIVGGGVRT
jgi:exosortase